jgi:hypothetical protein
MTCESCGKAELVEGTLEGVSFEPSSEHQKFFARGVYGIKAMACPSCGRVSDFYIDVESLKRALNK